jgi:two-component system nitrogen regulation response regulator NtrX
MFSMPNILIVDDEAGIRDSLAGVLTDEGYSASSAESGEACLERLRKGAFDVVLLDIWLPGIDGLETLERIRQLDNPPEVIMISGHGTIETAVRATKLGAYDFLEKPLSLDKTLILVKNAVESKKLERENVDLKKQLHARSTIVGDSIPMKALRQQIGLMAPTNGRVLIYGESGSGKELVAHAIHAQSLRKDQTFVEVNCAAIPEDLIESELFGHHKGSFSGAATDKEGKFQKANEGTLFLDEVGDMSLKTQSKVLRTLEEQRFIPVGSEETITVDVRVIASTNKDLEEEISKGNFREDLFYRLNVIPFFVPPLRERKEDIPLFARYFLKELAATYGRRPREITDEAIELLMRYSWPGNVRELRNVIERIVIMNPTTTRFDRKHLPPLVYRDGNRRASASESTS